MIQLFFLFTWQFWKGFFIVMGIIFCIYILVMVALVWYTACFDEPEEHYWPKHYDQ